MKVIIMGAGKVGYYLTQTLLEHGHEPVVVETNKVFCRRAANDLGVKVIWTPRASGRRAPLSASPARTRPIWWPASWRGASSTSPRR